MKFFTKNYSYDGNMDSEVVPLCDAINSLPGLRTTDSCCGHGYSPLTIFFEVEGRFDGLFFLTRCVDKRYFKYGYLWKIELSVGDLVRDGRLPVNYCLSSGPIMGDDVVQQAEALLQNMNDHLNIPKFLEIFNLDLNDFELS